MRGGFTLSKDQQAAAEALRAVVAQRQHKVMLLDGVTGSGKTEVYFEAMAAALASGGQVLLLLPEIALTQPFLERVERRFGCEPAQWHSDVRPRERERVWRGVADGTARIVVGARSALFLPWKRLKLIVVDEEHESAYKQDDGVPYHARDMAVLYGSIGKFPVVLSSATPSLETLVNVDRGRYGVVRLKDRHGRPELPEIGLIDMKRVASEPGTWISPPLFEEVAKTLAEGDQALLFLNRRGYAPLDPVPRLRPPAGMPELRGLAGGAPLPPAADVPSLRPPRADAEGMPELPHRGQDGAGGPGRRAAGGGGGGALSRGAHRHPVERPLARHAAARCDPRCGGGAVSISSSARSWWPRGTTFRI